jgi:hypothetical protein
MAHRMKKYDQGADVGVRAGFELMLTSSDACKQKLLEAKSKEQGRVWWSKESKDYFALWRTPVLPFIMHRALFVEDIVSAIVLEACADDRHARDYIRYRSYQPRKENMRTVLARTSRVFSEPALDLIWHTPSLWALAEVMPNNIWTVVPKWTLVERDSTRKERKQVRLGRWLGSKTMVRNRPGLRRIVESLLLDKVSMALGEILVSIR